MPSNMVRWGGLAGVVAAVMFVLTTVLTQLTPPQRVYDSLSDYLIQIVALVGYAGALGAILGIHTLHRQSGRYGRLGAMGSLLAFIGYAIIFVVTAISVLQGGQALLSVRLTGGAAVLIGSILLGVMTIRTQGMPWWCGVLLIVAFPLGDLSNAIVSGGEGLLLGILWGAVGYALLSLRGPVAEQPSRVS